MSRLLTFVLRRDDHVGIAEDGGQADAMAAKALHIEAGSGAADPRHLP